MLFQISACGCILPKGYILGSFFLTVLTIFFPGAAICAENSPPEDGMLHNGPSSEESYHGSTGSTLQVEGIYFKTQMPSD